MRTFLRSRAEAKYTESSVEQPAESSAQSIAAEPAVTSIVKQPAETFASVEALNRLLRTQNDALSGADFQRLRAAVVTLTKK